MVARKLDTQSASDMLEINQNLSRNFMSTDEKNWKVWENTFADDLTIDFGGIKPLQKTTPKDLMDWAKQAYAIVKTQHMLFNMDIHLDGDRASKSYGHARHHRTDNGEVWHIMRFTITNMCRPPTAGGFQD